LEEEEEEEEEEAGGELNSTPLSIDLKVVIRFRAVDLIGGWLFGSGAFPLVASRGPASLLKFESARQEPKNPKGSGGRGLGPGGTT